MAVLRPQSHSECPKTNVQTEGSRKLRPRLLQESHAGLMGIPSGAGRGGARAVCSAFFCQCNSTHLSFGCSESQKARTCRGSANKWSQHCLIYNIYKTILGIGRPQLLEIRGRRRNRCGHLLSPYCVPGTPAHLVETSGVVTPSLQRWKGSLGN